MFANKMNQNQIELIAALRGKVELEELLIKRADIGDHHGVYDLLSQGAAVDACDENGWTPLLAASRNGHFGAKIQTFDDNLKTPLSIAAQSGNKRLVKYFLSKGGNLEIKDEEDKTPTMRAVESKNRQVILLVEFSTQQNLEIYETTEEEKSLGKLLVPLALEYNFSDFKLCLRHGAEIDARTLDAALAGCKLDMALESFTNIQSRDDDFKKIQISIEMVQESVRHGVEMHAMQHSYENVLIAALIAAVECEGLLELFPKLRRIVGIALQRNDEAAGWTPR